jgi:TolA-binding protein
VRAEVRHQLKQDRFSRKTIEVAEATAHWSAEHKNKLIGGAIALVLLITTLLGSWYYLEQQDEKASVDLGRATQILETPIRPAGMPAQPDYPSFGSSEERATAARKEFQSIIDKYPHTHAADFSHYLLGVTAISLGDNATAERELKNVAGYYNHDLSSLAKLSLASIYRNTGRTKEALDLYKELINKPSTTVTKSTAEVQLAETYQASGNTSEAKKQYEQIQKEDPKSEAAQLATSKLQELK